MSLHKHWSVPAHADEPIPAEVASVAPTTPLVVWTAIYRIDDNDPVVRVFPTAGDCDKWRLACARDDYSEWDDDLDDETNVDAYFEDGDASFGIDHHTVKPYNG